ncbi:MAG: hypothetical protein GX446_01725 [Chthonomonadales bacterium]|nr:hypothetical protein [Chthonomonadales bacterium]
MKTKRPHGAWMLCGMLCAALVLTTSVGAQTGKRAEKGNLGHVLKKTLLLFPFDVPSSTATNAEELSALLTDAAASRLIASNQYTVTTFYRAWPPVARLHNDQQLPEADIIPPFAEDNRKSVKVAKAVGYDTVCVGSLDDYQYNESDRQVTVTVSGRILVVETGQVLKNVSLSASSAKGNERSKEEELNLDAVRQASEKLMAQLAPVGGAVVVEQPVKTTTEKKKRNNDWVWGLLAIGLGLGIGLSGGGGSGGSGIESPPPPPR